jgi:hypothetical protein
MALKLTTKSTVKNSSAATPPEEATKIATKFRSLALTLDSIEADLKITRADLLTVVNEYRDKRLTAGQADTSITIPTTDGNKVMVVYPEKYKSLPYENVSELKRAFGADYSLFVEEVEEISLKDEVSIDAIRKAAGKNADAVMALFEVKNSVKPRKGAFLNIANMYKSGDAEKGRDLTDFVDATIGSPQVRK